MDSSTPLEHFLQRATALTIEQWTTVYWRFANDPAVKKAVRKFTGIANQEWLDHFKSMSADAKAEQARAVEDINRRVGSLVAPLPEDELDVELGGPMRQRIQWIIVHAKIALEHVELLNADQACRRAARKFFTIFEGLIEVPEFR